MTETIFDIIGIGTIVSAVVVAGVLLAAWIIVFAVSVFDWWRHR